MESYAEVDVIEFVKLMKDCLQARTDAQQYRRSYFELMKKPAAIPSEDVSRILQQAYDDADDYDPAIRLPYTIEEPELKRRVSNSVKELEARGYRVE